MKLQLGYFKVIFLLIATNSIALTQDTVYTKTASDFYPEDKAKVLVVGTFHFHYPGLDAIKADEEDKIDVLKEPKKTEVAELVEYIKRFKPNKIAIEATDSWNANERYTKYKNGEFRDKRDERYVVAMRIASDLGIDSLYSIDAESFDQDLLKLDTSFVIELFEDFDFKSDDPFNQYTTDWIDAENKAVSKTHLLEYFKLINSRESHQYGYGAYLVGDFKLDDYRGADVLSVWWYNRNLRIFRKIQQLSEGTEDRIMILIGNGHAAILRQLFECSPEFEFVEFDGL